MKFSKAPKCPDCGGVTVKREYKDRGRTKSFFGCADWPNCKKDLVPDGSNNEFDLDYFDGMTSVTFGDQD